jgi:hypothetical protein
MTTLSGRVCFLLTILARIDMAASVAIATARLLWLAWH